MSDIRPRIDEHGVGWCDPGCPSFRRSSFEQYDPSTCRIDGKRCLGRVCLHHARRVAAERDRLAERVRASHEVLAGIVAYNPPDMYPDAEAELHACDGSCDPLPAVADERDKLREWARGALDELIKEREAAVCSHWILDLIETYPHETD